MALLRKAAKNYEAFANDVIISAVNNAGVNVVSCHLRQHPLF